MMYPFSPKGKLGLFFTGNWDYWENVQRIRISGSPADINHEYDISTIQFIEAATAFLNGIPQNPPNTVAIYTTRVFDQNQMTSYQEQVGTGVGSGGFMVEAVGRGEAGVNVNVLDLDYDEGGKYRGSTGHNTQLPPKNSGSVGSGGDDGSNTTPDPNYTLPIIGSSRIPMKFIFITAIVLLSVIYWSLKKSK